MISALKNDFEVTALVSMADDGGSTGRLRKKQGTSAVGDIRQCLVAFADSENSKNLFSYRFGGGALEGHSFGNIFLTTIEKSTGDLYKAIDQAKHVLDIKTGNVVPITDDKPYLTMEYDRKTVQGVYKIANTKIKGKEADFKLDPHTTTLSTEAKKQIEVADLLIIAPGNFYCSIMPALITKGLASSLSKSKAQKIMVSNLVNFSNHTKGFTATDYISEIERLVSEDIIDLVIANNNYLVAEDEEAVRLEKSDKQKAKILEEDLVSSESPKTDPNDKIAAIRSNTLHDKAKLNKIITQILKS